MCILTIKQFINVLKIFTIFHIFVHFPIDN